MNQNCKSFTFGFSWGVGKSLMKFMAYTRFSSLFDCHYRMYFKKSESLMATFKSHKYYNKRKSNNGSHNAFSPIALYLEASVYLFVGANP
jgi:hypothetical protein